MLMKKFLFLVVFCVVLLSACGQKEHIKESNTVTQEIDETGRSAQTDNRQMQESETENSDVQSTVESDSASQADDTFENKEETKSEDVGNSVSESNQSSVTEPDLYVGEYNDYDNKEPGLEIKKNSDGIYIIQVRIFGLMSLDDGEGTLTEQGIEFTGTAPNGEPLGGIITLDGDDAIVQFLSDFWSEYSDVSEYRYYKTSDVPNIYESSY